MSKNIYIVTGAPGAGKSTALSDFLQLHTDYLGFDVDWLLAPATALANKSVVDDASTWKPFRQLWMAVLEGILMNNKVPVLFAAINNKDIAELDLPDGVAIQWLLLDCSDEVRRTRLASRTTMSEDDVGEALEDAEALRAEIADKLMTDSTSPPEAAQQIEVWISKVERGKA